MNASGRPLCTLVVFDAAENSFGRACLLGRLLEPVFRIEVMGFAGGPTWLPCAAHGWPERLAPRPPDAGLAEAVRALASRASADVVLACKPWPVVLDLAEQVARRTGAARVLDIDDWELGWFASRRWWVRLKLALRDWRRPEGPLRTWLAERRARTWPTRLVSNRFLERRFGGHYVPHACDTDELDPAKGPSREQARADLGLPAATAWVGFVGTPRPHKGLDLLVSAVARLGRRDVGLLLAGVAPSDGATAELARSAGAAVVTLPPFPRARLSTVLASLDVVTVPQRDVPAARGQVPAKLFDAMAAGRPVVATDVGDAREVLGGGGLVVPPDDVAALSEALRQLLGDAELRRSMGSAGRDRCVEHYGHGVVGARLRAVVQESLRDDPRL